MRHVTINQYDKNLRKIHSFHVKIMYQMFKATGHKFNAKKRVMSQFRIL